MLTPEPGAGLQRQLWGRTKKKKGKAAAGKGRRKSEMCGRAWGAEMSVCWGEEVQSGSRKGPKGPWAKQQEIIARADVCGLV